MTLSVTVSSVIMLSIAFFINVLSVIMLSVVMLSVVMLSVIMLNVGILSMMALLAQIEKEEREKIIKCQKHFFGYFSIFNFCGFDVALTFEQGILTERKAQYSWPSQ